MNGQSNNKILVIMESPTKTKAIQSYLGNDYYVTSSEGHIRNLSSTGELSLGVNLETFEPKYKLERNKKEIVNKLKKLATSSKLVILATDPDREGEAIAYHLKEVLKIEGKYKRVTFNEITKNVVLNSFQNLRDINMDLFKSQETRRILDRLIGYRLSKLLYKKIKSKSAGRVQSVTLKILVDRENERSNFVQEEYWTVEGLYKNNNVKLLKFNGNKINLKTEEETVALGKKLNKTFVVNNILESIRIKKPPKPLKTSTLLQNASNYFNFLPSKTSIIAQQLYEGIKLDDGKIKGFITYPRTDSQRLSQFFIDETNLFIEKLYGNKYVGKYEFKLEKNSQDAHEAIRPTDPNMTPKIAKKFLKPEQYKLYKHIYNVTVSSLMANAKYLVKKVTLDNNGYEFTINGSILEFDGFLKVYTDDEEVVNKIINLNTGDKISLDKLSGIQHFTLPAPKFNIASLIKQLEELGIGRPSTYSLTIFTLVKRGYVTVENKVITPTQKGILTNQMLQEYFYDIINESYTSKIEEKLDEIANGKIDYLPLLKDFWLKFEPRVLNAMENMREVPTKKAGIICPECNSDLVYRYGAYGEFIGCGNFPKCRYILQKASIIGKCPKCNIGDVVIKMNKRKQKIQVCNSYPNCNYIELYVEKKSSKTIKEKKLYEVNLL